MRRQTGFTLIELMITVIVVGVLTAIAIPSYTQYVQRSNQSSAQQFMVEVASRAEQYRMDARDFPDGFSADDGDLDIAVPDRVKKYYDITLDADNSASPPTYTVSADPRDGTSQDGMDTLTLDAAGNKSPSDAW